MKIASSLAGFEIVEGGSRWACGIEGFATTLP
jgi:hypothetical protein